VAKEWSLSGHHVNHESDNVPQETGRSLASTLSHTSEASDNYSIFSPRQQNGERLHPFTSIKVMVFPKYVF
jgi:hypothetical protein